MMNFKPQRQLIEPNSCSWYFIKGFYIILNLSLIAVAGLLISECVKAAGIIRNDPRFTNIYEHILHKDPQYLKGDMNDAELSLGLMIPTLILLFIQSIMGLGLLFTISLKWLYIYVVLMYLTFIMISATLFIGKMAGPYLIGGLIVEPIIMLMTKKIISVIVDFNGLD